MKSVNTIEALREQIVKSLYNLPRAASWPSPVPQTVSSVFPNPVRIFDSLLDFR